LFFQTDDDRELLLGARADRPSMRKRIGFEFFGFFSLNIGFYGYFGFFVFFAFIIGGDGIWEMNKFDS